MNNETFEKLVREALEGIPEEFKDKLDNVAVTIADNPSPEQQQKFALRRGTILFGLYEGVPQTKRGNYSMIPPDKITIFRNSILNYWQEEEDLKEQVRKTVLHEVGHHFGMSEEALQEIT